MEIRVHVLNKISAYLLTNICLQVGYKTTYCPLQCDLDYSIQQRFSHGPAPCSVSVNLDEKSVLLSKICRQMVSNGRTEVYFRLCSKAVADEHPLGAPSTRPPGGAEHSFHKSPSRLSPAKVVIC